MATGGMSKRRYTELWTSPGVVREVQALLTELSRWSSASLASKVGGSWF